MRWLIKTGVRVLTCYIMMSCNLLVQGPEFEEEAEEEEESYVEQTPYPPRGAAVDVEAVAEEGDGTRSSDGEDEDEQDTEEYEDEEEEDDVVYLVRCNTFFTMN